MLSRQLGQSSKLLLRIRVCPEMKTCLRPTFRRRSLTLTLVAKREEVSSGYSNCLSTTPAVYHVITLLVFGRRAVGQQVNFQNFLWAHFLGVAVMDDTCRYHLWQLAISWGA